jgi:formylglycine-generating enzyme required for sulfatase activity
MVEFTLIVKPPLTDTVSGDPSVFSSMPHVIRDDIVIFPQNAQEQERAANLGVSSDYGVILFRANEAEIHHVCNEIAARIVSHISSSPNEKIVVESGTDSTVISIDHTDPQTLSDLIYQTVTVSTTTEADTPETLSIVRKFRRSQCFTEPAIQLDLILIPGGTFVMGSPLDELGRWDDEGPQHEVTVSTFLMGRYPVTQAQWRAIATRTDLKVKHDLEPDPSEFEEDDRPVEQVSWYEAVEFCDRLSRLTQHTYRLPTEAEWEYACRAGTTTPFHFGETITTDLANYCGEEDESQPDEYPGHYGNGPKGEYRKTTTPVTHFHPLANAFGLCDMHGNVLEWCLDHWHDNYEGAPVDGSAWLSENENSSRVRRGGSWFSDPRYCRSACRFISNPGFRDHFVGFRVVCEARGL